MMERVPQWRCYTFEGGLVQKSASQEHLCLAMLMASQEEYISCRGVPTQATDNMQSTIISCCGIP